MQLGIVGKPNVGKSTFFNAATKAHAEVANYPFTTIEANRGVMYIRKPCPCRETHVTCTPHNSRCVNGIRFVPIEAIDVAGLVPDAHKGKGLGNKFLDDLRQAHALIHIVDASGSTDSEGNPCNVGAHDPLSDVIFLEKEINQWLFGIIKKSWEINARKCDLEGKKINKGFILAVNDSILRLEKNKVFVDIPVKTIGVIRTKRSVGNNILIGTLTGSVIMGGLLAATAEPDSWVFGYTPAEGALIGIFVGAPAGAFVGAITAAFKNPKTFTIEGDVAKWKAFLAYLAAKNQPQ